jgi:hypothetical protein
LAGKRDDLMAVYEGVLQKISGGKVISSEGRGGYWTHNMGITRYHKTGVDAQAGWTRREFVDIGDTRIRNVMLMPYYDELLQEAVGQEVALSVTGPPENKAGRNTVVAIRTPEGGVVRPSGKQLLIASIREVLLWWFAAPFVTAILVFASFLVAKITYGPIVWVGLVVAVAVGIGWMVWPFVRVRRMFRAAAALQGLDSR